MHRSTARLHRPAARRWPTAALSQGSAEDGQGPAPRAAAEGAAAVAGEEAERARAAANFRAIAAEEGPGPALGAAIASATQQFIERVQAAAPGNEDVQEMMRGMVRLWRSYLPCLLFPEARLYEDTLYLPIWAGCRTAYSCSMWDSAELRQ